jgi:hypothetical protein
VARCGCGDRIPARLLITIIALARAGHGWPHRLYHRRAVHAHPTVRACLPGGPGRPAWRFPCLIIGQLRWAGLQGPVHPRLIDGWNWLISQQAHRSTVVGVMDGPGCLAGRPAWRFPCPIDRPGLARWWPWWICGVQPSPVVASCRIPTNRWM